MSAIIIPKNLISYLKVITGYHRQLIRFYADRSGAINSQDVLRWTLPREILNITTLTHFLQFTTSYYGSKTGPVYQGFYFPRNSSSIIDTLTVFINGQVYESIPSYNHLFNIIYDNTQGANYYQSGIRQLESGDPSTKFTIDSNEALTVVVQGASVIASTDPSDISKDLQIRNFIGFLGSVQPTIIDLRNVEVIVEIRYAVPQIMFKGADITATTTPTAAFTIDKYYMTIERILFDDDYYGLALSDLKNSGHYTLVFRTFNVARGASVAKTSNPTLQFSTTAKYMSKLYGTFVDGSNNTTSTIQNTSNGKTFATHISDPSTYPNAFNQSIYFKKNAVSLTDSQFEINGVPVYPYPQTLIQIKNNNLTAFGIDYDLDSADYPGLFDINTWSKYGFLQVVPFEHDKSFDSEELVSGYPNTQNTNLNIKWTTNFASTATGNIYMYCYVEKFVFVHFNGNSVIIEM